MSSSESSGTDDDFEIFSDIETILIKISLQLLLN